MSVITTINYGNRITIQENEVRKKYYEGKSAT